MSTDNSRHDDIVKKLDLDGYLNSFIHFLARDKGVALEGDISRHYKYIESLARVDFPAPVEVPLLTNQFARLGKQAVLSLGELYDFVKMIGYFNRLKAVTFQEPVSSWIKNIDIPDEITSVVGYFTDDGEINVALDNELFDIEKALQKSKQNIKESLYGVTKSSKMVDYLIDMQVHLQNGEECLLVRGGFSSAIKASVIGRSSGGFFYIVPSKISELKSRQSDLLDKKEEIIWKYCQEFSKVFHKWERFLRYIDQEYDRFDHYQARVNFAKSNDYEFVLPQKGKDIELSNFAHPAIKNPVPISLTFHKKIMLVTGVNAGGKTMLLKSILSAIYMSKNLLPFQCNKSHTRIGRFKNIEAIIDDPQSVKNDISTFAGRMQEFARLFRERDVIVGVDEIELGTDADEAAALFKVMLEDLKDRGVMFVITTHHKRLAALMAEDDDVELVATLYDEANSLPTFRYLQGSIGKSYAFETAKRYGISQMVVDRAKEFFGEDKERLGELIEKSTTLEREMRLKIAALDEEQEKLRKRNQELDSFKEKMKEEQKKALATLENRYNAATKRAQKALKTKDSSDGRRLLNEAHKHKLKAKPKTEQSQASISAGDKVKYRSHQADVISVKTKEAMISVDGIKMRVPLADLKLSMEVKTTAKRPASNTTTTVEKGRASVSIKLLGVRGDDALERVDSFISNALLHGLQEVEIIHGIGGGILSRLISQYLKEHPKVVEFHRVQGNLGATIVKL